MNLKIQSGRSMVEMLGTLAIIGVLSIGGIAGYKYGMDKYRANETLRNISLRTVDLITQASQGRPALSFAEWENEDTVYDFSNPAYCDSDDNLIIFDIGATEKIPQNICQIIFDGLSNVAVQIDINESPAISKDSCGKNNTMTFYFAGGGNASVDNDTGEGAAEEKCGSTVCGTCQKCENETCVTVADYEQKCTTDDNKSGWCVGETCQAETCNCDTGYYCADTNGSCEHPTSSGTCVEAKSKFKEEVIDGTTYYISRNTMTWWDGMSACKAMGKKMINHNEITQSCSASDVDCSSVNTKLNAIGKFLYEVVWSNSQGVFIWSNVVYDSCNAYYVSLSRGMVEEGGVRTNYYQGFYTICK